VAASKSKSGKSAVAAARGSKSGGAFDLRKLWEQFKSLAGTLAIFLVLRAFLVEAYRIPSPSMVPSMLVGDWLFVTKVRYGPHIPFTRSHLPGYAEPERGDIVVFESPPQYDQPEDLTPTLVKRLIGMPGDTIYSREGVVYINGVAQRQGFASPEQAKGDGSYTTPLFDWQKQFALKGSRFGEPLAEPQLDHWGPMIVPAGHYWMMGDNRYDSKDSRYWGFVPRENVRGRPMFVYYSYVPSDVSDRPLSFLTDIRWRRLGHWIK
jgi:signal peptidase I